MSRIAVVGAGITGITTAYALSERGFDVTVFDRQRYPAMETSFANGGQLSASNAEVWNSWSTVLKGMKWMLRHDAPLLLNPKPSWHKLSWLAEFVGQIPQYRAHTVETVRLAIAARAVLHGWAERERIDFDCERRGILHIYRDEAGFRHAESVNALLTEGGLDRRPVTPSEMVAIEPNLHGRYYGGFFTPSDATGDIHRFTRGLAAAGKRRGVRFVQDAVVSAITTTAGGVDVSWTVGDSDEGAVRTVAERQHFDAVVICAGLSSRRLAAGLGDRVNIYPVKGYSITVHLDDPVSQAGAPSVSLLDDGTKIVSSRFGPTRFRVAGTAEFNGENRDIRYDRIQPLVRWVRQLFPDVDTSRTVPWAGLRPMTPSMLPRVGAGSRPGVFYNTGHGHLGWTLSAATAELVAEAVAAQVPGAERRAAA
jgi:D-amino-acid dehydrogenase